MTAARAIIEVVTENVSTLLQVAQAKVAAPNDVVVSSIPPRTDSTSTQQRLEELNYILPFGRRTSSQLPEHKPIGYEPWSDTSRPGSTKHQDLYDSESR